MNFFGKKSDFETGKTVVGGDKKNISPDDDIVLAVKETTSTFDTEEAVKSMGEADGQNRIPETTAYAPSQFEQGILARGDTRIHSIVEAAQQARSVINRDLQPTVSQLKEINVRWRNLRDRIDERKKELNRDFIVPVNNSFHVAIVVFLGLGELPLNALVFRMFGEPEYMTYIMSSTLAVTIPLMANFFGLIVRNTRRWLANAIVGFLLPVSILGALGAVTYVREIYLKTGGHVANETNNMALGYSIFALNLLIFTAAMVTSFLSHDPDESLDNLRRGIVSLERRRKPLLGRYSVLASRMNAILRVANARMESERSRTLSLVYLYRQANSKGRAPNPAPMVFSRPPEIKREQLWEPLVENPDEI